MALAAFFTPAAFQFLRDLRQNNTREWFQAHKDRYERDVKAPMEAFIMALDGPLREISSHYAADPRTSLFRIHRDTRFAKDKSPYKLHVGAQFRHVLCPRNPHAPGFYLHLEPDQCFAASGVWHPDGQALGRIRARIAHEPKAWRTVQAAVGEVKGDSLKRVPPGFPSDHPCAEDLKLKDFYAMVPLSEQDICASGLLDHYLDICGRHAPLMRFLAGAMELPW